MLVKKNNYNNNSYKHSNFCSQRGEGLVALAVVLVIFLTMILTIMELGVFSFKKWMAEQKLENAIKYAETDSSLFVTCTPSELINCYDNLIKNDGVTSCSSLGGCCTFTKVTASSCTAESATKFWVRLCEIAKNVDSNQSGDTTQTYYYYKKNSDYCSSKIAISFPGIKIKAQTSVNLKSSGSETIDGSFTIDGGDAEGTIRDRFQNGKVLKAESFVGTNILSSLSNLYGSGKPKAVHIGSPRLGMVPSVSVIPTNTLTIINTPTKIDSPTEVVTDTPIKVNTPTKVVENTSTKANTPTEEVVNTPTKASTPTKKTTNTPVQIVVSTPTKEGTPTKKATDTPEEIIIATQTISTTISSESSTSSSSENSSSSAGLQCPNDTTTCAPFGSRDSACCGSGYYCAGTDNYGDAFCCKNGKIPHISEQGTVCCKEEESAYLQNEKMSCCPNSQFAITDNGRPVCCPSGETYAGTTYGTNPSNPSVIVVDPLNPGTPICCFDEPREFCGWQCCYNGSHCVDMLGDINPATGRPHQTCCAGEDKAYCGGTCCDKDKCFVSQITVEVINGVKKEVPIYGCCDDGQVCAGADKYAGLAICCRNTDKDKDQYPAVCAGQGPNGIPVCCHNGTTDQLCGDRCCAGDGSEWCAGTDAEGHGTCCPVGTDLIDGECCPKDEQCGNKCCSVCLNEFTSTCCDENKICGKECCDKENCNQIQQSCCSEEAPIYLYKEMKDNTKVGLCCKKDSQLCGVGEIQCCKRGACVGDGTVFNGEQKCCDTVAQACGNICCEAGKVCRDNESQTCCTKEEGFCEGKCCKNCQNDVCCDDGACSSSSSEGSSESNSQSIAPTNTYSAWSSSQSIAPTNTYSAWSSSQSIAPTNKYSTWSSSSLSCTLLQCEDPANAGVYVVACSCPSGWNH